MILCTSPSLWTFLSMAFMSFIIRLLVPASAVLRLIFVEEVCRERPLISHMSHSFLWHILSIICLGPIA